jgi:hypothetical protein
MATIEITPVNPYEEVLLRRREKAAQKRRIKKAVREQFAEMEPFQLFLRNALYQTFLHTSDYSAVMKTLDAFVAAADEDEDSPVNLPVDLVNAVFNLRTRVDQALFHCAAGKL